MPQKAEIIDKTCMALSESSGQASPPPAELAALILKTGAAAAEVPPALFFRLRHLLPAHKLAVRVQNRRELFFCSQAGAVRFITGAAPYTESFAKDSFPRLTVELRFSGLQDYLSQRAAAAAGLCRHTGGVRVSGLRDVLSGDFRGIFEQLRQDFGSGLTLDVSDGDFCATAACFEWLNAGGASACASFAGADGGAFLEELLLSLNLLSDAQYDLTCLPAVRRVYERLAGKEIGRFKPVAGSGIFAFESGIHADGIFKNPVNYEPFRPESVGLRRRLVIGKNSGREAIRMKLRALHIRTDDSTLGRLNEAVRSKSIQKQRSLHNSEILDLYHSLAGEGGAELAER